MSKVVGFLRTPGDIVSIVRASVYAGVNWENSSKEQNFVNIMEIGIAGIGFFPVEGDIFNLWYLGVTELSKTEGFPHK